MTAVGGSERAEEGDRISPLKAYLSHLAFLTQTPAHSAVNNGGRSLV